ncbi:MAG: phosphatase PAP2 family protein [Bacteroidales bacterium]|nr:phosphatase PAP2 family protein [Bacteroidales bacterium]
MHRKNFRKIYFVLIIVFFYETAFPGISNDSVFVKKAGIDKYFFKSFFLDCRDVAVSPIYWNKKKLIATSIFVGLSAICYTQDEEIQKIFQKNKNVDLDNISKYGLEPLASKYTMIAVPCLSYLGGVVFKNERIKKTALLSAKALAISSMISVIVKYSAHRQRPYEAYQANSKLFDGPSFEDKHLSFVSGHTISIFSVATIFASEYKDIKMIPVISYSLAGLAGISRIYENDHWASDVVFGAALGFGIAKLIYNKNNWKIQLTPYSNGKTTGMAAVMKL